MNLKSEVLNHEKTAYCTVCGDNLRDQRLEKYQIRWDNKNSGVCQGCIVSLRKSFKTQRNKTPIKFRTKQFYELMEFDEQCVAMAESSHGTILGEIKDSEDDSTLGVIIDEDCEDQSLEDILEESFEEEEASVAEKLDLSYRALPRHPMENPSDEELALIEALGEQE